MLTQKIKNNKQKSYKVSPINPFLGLRIRLLVELFVESLVNPWGPVGPQRGPGIGQRPQSL